MPEFNSKAPYYLWSAREENRIGQVTYSLRNERGAMLEVKNQTLGLRFGLGFDSMAMALIYMMDYFDIPDEQFTPNLLQRLIPSQLVYTPLGLTRMVVLRPMVIVCPECGKMLQTQDDVCGGEDMECAGCHHKFEHMKLRPVRNSGGSENDLPPADEIASPDKT